MEQVWPQLRPKYKLINLYHKVPHPEVHTGTAVWKRRAYSSERRTVWFGKGRLETQVKLCAGRPLHFVVLTRTKEDAEASKAELTEWLAVRGLCLSEEKTSITHLDDGVDFLGFNIKRYKATQKKTGYSIYTKPSKKSIKKFKTRVYEIIKRRLSSSPRETLAELNPLIRGWGIYFRSGVSKKVFEQLDSYIWGRTWHCYTKRRHPNKGKKWRKQKYYKVIRGFDWTFYDEDSGVNIHRLAHIPIVRHIKVKRDASPDDPALQEYWQLRQRRPKELSREKAILWVRQKGICPICEEWLDNEEELHTHHTRGREVEDWKYKQLLHETCHHQVTINGTA